MFNLLDPSEFVKRFVATITLTKEDRNLFELGKLERPQISKLAEIISEAQSGSVEASGLLEKLKTFEFPKIEIKTPAKKKKAPEKRKTKGEELEEKESELLEKEKQALSDEKDLTKELKDLKESLSKAEQKKEQAASSKKSKKEKNTTESVDTKDDKDPGEEIVEVEEDSEELKEDSEELKEDSEEDTEELEEDSEESGEETEELDEEEEKLRANIREVEDKLKKAQTLRNEAKKTREEVSKTISSSTDEELQEEVEEEIEEVIIEGYGLSEASKQFKNFISNSNTEEDLDFVEESLMKKFKGMYKEEGEYLTEKGKIEAEISKKRRELSLKKEREGLLPTLGQDFYKNLQNSTNLFDINDAVSVLAAKIDTSADLINTEDYKYIFKSEEVKKELCKEISEENFNFTEMRSLLIDSGIAQDEATEGSPEEEAATSRYLTLAQIMEKAIQVAGINELSMGELSDKAGVSLEDYAYKREYEEIIDQMLSSEEALSFSDDQKKILRAFCDIFSEKIVFDASEEESLGESFLEKFEESMKSLGKGKPNETLINSLTYIYENDIDSLEKSIKNIKNYISDEVPVYQINPNIINAVTPLFRDLLEKKEDLNEEKKALLNKYRINILSDYVDINQNLLSAKLLPFISKNVSLTYRDLRDFKDIIKYFLIIYDSARNPFEGYENFEKSVNFEKFTNIFANPSVSLVENNEDYLSQLFYAVSENPEKSALMIHDLYLANKFKDLSTVGFETIINEKNKNNLIQSFDKDNRLEIYTKDTLLKSLRALIPQRGRVTFHSILHNIRKSFKPRETAPIIETEEDILARKEEESSEKNQESILEKIRELDLPSEKEISEEVSSQGEKIEESILNEEVPLKSSDFESFDNFIDLVSQRNMSKVSPGEFLDYISPFEDVKDFDSEKILEFQKYIKENLSDDIIDLTAAMKSDSLELIFGNLRLKSQSVNVYTSILYRIGAIIFSPEATAKSASEDLSKYINSARSQNLNDNFYKIVNNLLEEPTVDEAKSIEIKTIDSKEPIPSNNSCQKIKSRGDLSLYSFYLSNLKNNSKRLKAVSANEYKELKSLCKNGKKANLYSFVSSVVSNYSDKLSKEELESFFSGAKEMPNSLSDFLLEGFGNEFVRPSSILLGGEVSDQNIVFMMKDLEGDGSEFSESIYSKIKEMFSDRYRFAKNLFVCLLGWNLDQGIYFDVDRSLVHVSKNNSRLAFDDIKNKIGFVSANVSKEVLNGDLKLEEMDEDLEDDFKRNIKYYDDYSKGEYSKEFLNMVKNNVQTPAIQEATTVKVVDKLADQKKSEVEIAKDISDFCQAISLLNKSKAEQGFSPYKQKDLFASQKYKKLLSNSKVNIAGIIEKICNEEERSLSSIAALLFKPSESTFDSFLSGNFTKDLTEKQFTSSIGKLLNEFGKKEDILDYSKKIPTEAKKSFSNAQYYKGLSEKILEKMDPRIILGIIVQSAFFDKQILPDSEKPIEIIFSDDVIPVRREDFDSQINILNGFVIASINEMISEANDISKKSKEEDTIAKSEADKSPKSSTSEDDKEFSLFEKIKSKLSEDNLDREELYDISVDIASYRDEEMLSEQETEELSTIWEEKAEKAPIKVPNPKKKYKLKTNMVKKTKSPKEDSAINEVSDFYKTINGYIVDQEESIDNFNLSGKVFSFDLAEESLDDLSIALKSGDLDNIAEEIPDYPEDVELILTQNDIKELSKETERVSDKLIDARVSFDYLRAVPGTENIRSLKELESKAREIYRSESGKDKYVFFKEDFDGLSESLLMDSSKVLGEVDQEGVMINASFYHHKDIDDFSGEPATIIIVDPSIKGQSMSQYRNYLDAQSDDISERIINN